MIRAVTFQGAQNFKANLYALEVKSRFIDQINANGFYKGYGNELSCTVSGMSAIVIGSGAFLVQGRAVEIISSETVNVAFENGKVGYIVAKIETNPADNIPNCTLIAKTGATLSSIILTQEDTYQYSAESENKVYELPLYSFSMQNDEIQSIQKLISPIAENEDIYEQIFAINERLDNLGFKSGSLALSGGIITENSFTRQGNYIIGRVRAYSGNTSETSLGLRGEYHTRTIDDGFNTTEAYYTWEIPIEPLLEYPIETFYAKEQTQIYLKLEGGYAYTNAQGGSVTANFSDFSCHIENNKIYIESNGYFPWGTQLGGAITGIYMSIGYEAIPLE